MHKSRKKSQDAPCSACDFTLLIFPPANSEVCCSTADEVKHQGAQLFYPARRANFTAKPTRSGYRKCDRQQLQCVLMLHMRQHTSIVREGELHCIGMMRYIRKKTAADAAVFCVGIDLSSRSVSRQVLSALVSLTSVFGMGTGGPSPLKTPTI